MGNNLPGQAIDTEMLYQAIQDLRTQQWLLQEEFKAYCALNNGHIEERIIDFAAPDWLLQEHLARYRFAATYARGGKTLDMACGTGYGSHYLLKYGNAASVTGVDIDSVAVRYANQRYSQDRLSYHVADVCTAWTDAKFNTIVSFETIEHVPGPDAMLKQVATMLHQDGTFVVSTPVRQQGRLTDQPLNPHHLREWTVDEFTGMLKGYFREIDVFGQYFVQRKRFGIVPLPYHSVRLAARLCGKEQALNDARNKVMRFEDRLPFFTKPNPIFMVCICKQPIVDPA